MRREIIAEIGQNHNGSIDEALKLIDSAKECGADVAKFQLYDAKKLFPKVNNPWFEYNCMTELSRADVELLFEHCSDVGIEFMSSVFDLERLQWLEDLGVRRHKIASRSISDASLVKAVLGTNKPTFVSLGHWDHSSLPSFDEFSNYHFMHCVSQYPAPLETLKLGAVDFESVIGFSDHSIGITAACSSFVLGSTVLEKHFTLNQDNYGPDHICSMSPEELTLISRFRDEILSIL